MRPSITTSVQAREPAVASDSENGRVAVTVDVAATIEETWRCLTTPAGAAEWFGVYSQPLRAGAAVRLDFEDGDHFDLRVVRCHPPRMLEWRWRFLGVGPLDEVRWQLDVTADELTRVTVADRNDRRSASETRELGRGWVDFLARLERHVRQGVRTRYGWRAELDGSIELPPTASRILSPAVHGHWLPLADHALEPGTTFLVDGAGSHRNLTVAEVSQRTPSILRFGLRRHDRAVVSPCTVSLRRRGEVSALAFHQEAWAALEDGDDRRRALRIQLARTWVAALRRAHTVATGGSPRGPQAGGGGPG